MDKVVATIARTTIVALKRKLDFWNHAYILLDRSTKNVDPQIKKTPLPSDSSPFVIAQHNKNTTQVHTMRT